MQQERKEKIMNGCIPWHMNNSFPFGVSRILKNERLLILQTCANVCVCVCVDKNVNYHCGKNNADFKVCKAKGSIFRNKKVC